MAVFPFVFDSPPPTTHTRTNTRLCFPGAVKDRHACDVQRAAELPAAAGRVHGAHLPPPAGQRLHRLCGEDEGMAVLPPTAPPPQLQAELRPVLVTGRCST